MEPNAHPDDESSSDKSLQDDIAINNEATLAITNVYFYKRFARNRNQGSNGTLRLDEYSLSFTSEGVNFRWNLQAVESVSIEKSKRPGSMRGRVVVQHNGSKFRFRGIGSKAYEQIRSFINRTQSEEGMRAMTIKREKARETARDLAKKIQSNIVGDSRSPLYSVTRLPMKILEMLSLYILWPFCKLMEIFFNVKTLSASTNIDDALHEVRVNPILIVARKTLAKGRVRIIESDVEKIRDSLFKINQLIREEHPMYSCQGSVRESQVKWLDMTWIGLIFKRICSVMPFLNPSTVNEAIVIVNDKLLVLAEVTGNETGFSPEAKVQILEEVYRIQCIMANIQNVSSK